MTASVSILTGLTVLIYLPPSFSCCLQIVFYNLLPKDEGGTVKRFSLLLSTNGKPISIFNFFLVFDKLTNLYKL